MTCNRVRRHVVPLAPLLLGAAYVAAESPTVHIEHQARVDDPGGLRYVLAEGTMSGTLRGDATYTIPVQIHYPAHGGNGTAVLELTNSALLFFHLEARGARTGDRRSDAEDLDELEAMQVNFGWAGAREYLLRNGFTHMAIQHSKMVTDFMGQAPPEGRTRRRLCYGRIERTSDGYEIVRDAARWLAAPAALTGDAPPVPPHDHVIAYGLSGSGYLLRDYLIRGKNAGGEIDGFFVHAAGSKCLALIDDEVGSPRVYHWSTCSGPPPTNGAKVLAVDAQGDLEFNAGALAREGAVDDPDYVRWEVAGAPHVPVFAMDLTRLGAPQQNPMDWSPIWRSAFHYLDRWVKHGTAPPTAPPIEGRWEDEDTWKCDLDADGNAIGGIRLPPIEAPTGVYTGFDYSWLDLAVSRGHRYAVVFAYGGRFERFSDETLAKRYPSVADRRAAFEAAARRAFDAGYILEEDLRRYTASLPAVVHRNVVYGMHGGLALLMDVYEPAKSNGHALLFIAGSGWHWSPEYGAGGIKDAVATGELAGGGSHHVFADAGFTVFVINHRQAPLFRYPAALEDARRAVRYIRHHAHEYGVTEQPIAAFGISSGAHLSLMLALSDGAGDPESADEVERHSSKVDVVAAFAGPTDLTADWGARGTTAVTSFMGAPYWVPGGPHAEASPVTHVDRDDPPVLLIHGDADEIVPVSQARTLAASLRAHQLEFEYVEIAGGGHDFEEVLDHDPNGLPSFPAMARWLREHLPAPPPRDRFFDSAGVRIRYIDVGPRDGEPVVLVHGGFASVEGSWIETGVIDALDDLHRVIALDLRGHGRSDKPREPGQYGAEMAADVVRLLDHLGIEKAHVVGYSMGGHIVFKLIADHPERLRSAMPCGDGGRPVTGAFAEALRRTIATLEASGSFRPVLDYFVTPGSMSAEEVAAIDAALRDANDNKAMAAMLRNWRGMDADPATLAANRVPCLAIIGEDDPLLADLEATARRMPNLRVDIMRGYDHMTAFRDPGIADHIRAFVGAHASVEERLGVGAR